MFAIRLIVVSIFWEKVFIVAASTFRQNNFSSSSPVSSPQSPKKYVAPGVPEMLSHFWPWTSCLRLATSFPKQESKYSTSASRISIPIRARRDARSTGVKPWVDLFLIFRSGWAKQLMSSSLRSAGTFMPISLIRFSSVFLRCLEASAPGVRRRCRPLRSSSNANPECRTEAPSWAGCCCLWPANQDRTA